MVFTCHVLITKVTLSCIIYPEVSVYYGQQFYITPTLPFFSVRHTAVDTTVNKHNELPLCLGNTFVCSNSSGVESCQFHPSLIRIISKHYFDICSDLLICTTLLCY